MGLSVADIDEWDPESISAVGAAAAARAAAASEAWSSLMGLSAFDAWRGEGADAARARTEKYADGLDQHGQAASAVAVAANTAANEIRQVKRQLAELRATLGQYAITVDARGSRVVPPTNLSSLTPATRNLVQDATKIGQQSLDQLRWAAEQADAHLSNAMDPIGTSKASFDLDTQFNRPQGLVGGPGGAPPPESGYECVAGVTAVTMTVVQVTQTKTWWTQPGGSNGKHCA